MDRLHTTETGRRYFCFGKVDDKVVTVRFTYRNGKIRIFGAGYWREGKAEYEKQKKYGKAPKEIARAIAVVELIQDFLPGPDKLVFKEESVKVTLSLG